MSQAGREMEPWRVPVQALRALERQLRVQPGAFTLALAAERIIEKVSPDISAFDAAPLSGLAGKADRAARTSEPARGREQTKRARNAAEQVRAGAAALEETNRFANVSNLIGTALQRGQAMHAAEQGRTLPRGRSTGGDGKGSATVGKVAAALADGGVIPLPLDPARRGNRSVQASSAAGDKAGSVAGAFGAAASAAMEALQRAQVADPAPSAADGKRSPAKDGPLEAGFEAIRKVGRLADGLIASGADAVARPSGGLLDALARGAAEPSTGPGKGGGGGGATIGQVNRLATELLARAATAGAAGSGAGTAAGSSEGDAGRSSGAPGGTPPGGTTSVASSGSAVSGGPAPSRAADRIPAPPTAGAAASAAPPLPDASTLATLVNDVLMEQARRHGVDLT